MPLDPCPSPGCSRERLCAKCLDRDVYHLEGTAMRRGELWAERVIAAGRPRDRPWWTWEASRHVAERQVEDIGGADPRVREALARAAWEQARRTWGG